MSAPAVQREPLVEVRTLRKYFPVRGGLFSRVTSHVKAVEDVSFSIARGETFGLVGESGCGKTTVGRTMLRLIEPTSGRMLFDGCDVAACSGGELRALRRRMQIVFQDPYSSLNPRMTVGAIIGEPIRAHGLAKGRTLEMRVASLLERVGLPAAHRSRYPHEFSGGQRQRIGIARALALRPDFIVCDEAVSALDVSIQAQILNLFEDLQQEFHLSYLFISHDLNVVRHVADRVGVMYLGQLVEVAPSEEIFRNARHPYTQALMSANPLPDPEARTERIALRGEVPSALNPPAGCRFHTRCPLAMERCAQQEPPEISCAPDHAVRCFLAEAADSGGR